MYYFLAVPILIHAEKQKSSPKGLVLGTKKGSRLICAGVDSAGFFPTLSKWKAVNNSRSRVPSALPNFLASSTQRRRGERGEASYWGLLGQWGEGRGGVNNHWPCYHFQMGVVLTQITTIDFPKKVSRKNKKGEKARRRPNKPAPAARREMESAQSTQLNKGRHHVQDLFL